MAQITFDYAIEQCRQWLQAVEELHKEVLAPSKPAVEEAASSREIAWGAKVSPVFKERVLWIEKDLGVDANDLMACMAWESGESFSPSKKNMAGSGATGLIQFMPSTARTLGTTTAELAKLSAEDQLNYVWKYFAPWKGKLNNLGDVYMAILWPRGVGKPDSYVVFDGGIAYRQNAGLDVNKDGDVTRGECLTKVKDKLAKGLRKENRG